MHDPTTDRITHLDRVTAAVWYACDGRRDVASIAAAAGVTLDQAETAVDRLVEGGLASGGGLSRRTLLARAGAVAWTVPLVSIAAPSAAYAASPGTPPAVPEVGTITHTCRGAHTRVFTIPVTGLPANTSVAITATFSPGGVIPNSPVLVTTDQNGAATYRHEFRSVGNPVRCRTVVAVSYRPASDAVAQNIPVTPYEGCCP